MTENAKSLGGQKRLRIVVESIVRAGILAIPVVGAALEKLSFGPKDAVSQAELRAVIESIERLLREAVSVGQ